MAKVTVKYSTNNDHLISLQKPNLGYGFYSYGSFMC